MAFLGCTTVLQSYFLTAWRGATGLSASSPRSYLAAGFPLLSLAECTQITKVSCTAFLKFLPISILAGYLCPVFSQEKVPFENLSIDRPDVSNLPVTVLPGHYQVELGFEWDKNNDAQELYLPILMLRTGIGKKTELRVGFNYSRLDSVYEIAYDHISAASLSVKHRIVEEKGWRPAIALQPEVNILFTDETGASKQSLTYDFIFLFNNTFHKQVFLNYNAGFFWISESEKRVLVSASLSFLHTHRLGYFVEGYTLRTINESDNYSLDAGIMYLFTPRFQADIYCGRRWASTSPYLFLGGGIGFRIDKGDTKRRSFKELGIHH
jgi:hypothetical protein